MIAMLMTVMIQRKLPTLHPMLKTVAGSDFSQRLSWDGPRMPEASQWLGRVSAVMPYYIKEK